MGPTWAGKTTLALHLLPRREYVVVFGVKRKDETLDLLRRHAGYRVIREWPPPDPNWHKVILWPPMKRPEDQLRQREVFRTALRDIYRRGGWTVYLDEVLYITNDLKLPRHVSLLWQQGRSMYATIVAGTQRPAWIPLAAYSQVRHLFLFHGNDWRDLKRLGEIGGGMNSRRIAQAVQGLPMYSFLWIDTRTQKMAISQVEYPSSEGIGAAIDES